MKKPENGEKGVPLLLIVFEVIALIAFILVVARMVMQK
jgi:hypothetical protein